MLEIERNKRLIFLLQQLRKNNDFESIELLKTMVEKDTLAMQKSFEIIIGDGEVRPRSDEPSNP